MNASWPSTNDDCKKCCCSHIMDVGSDYEEREYVCSKGYYNQYAKADKKPCGLDKGFYYEATKVKGLDDE